MLGTFYLGGVGGSVSYNGKTTTRGRRVLSSGLNSVQLPAINSGLGRAHLSKSKKFPSRSRLLLIC